MYLFDKIYLYSYIYLRGGRGKYSANETASLVVAAFVIMHILSALIVLSIFFHRNLFSIFGKVGAAIGCCAVILYFGNHYVIRRNGTRVLRHFKSEYSDSKKWIGLCIILWAFALPIFVGAGANRI